jgi:hypothetical protein
MLWRKRIWACVQSKIKDVSLRYWMPVWISCTSAAGTEVSIMDSKVVQAFGESCCNKEVYLMDLWRYSSRKILKPDGFIP